jgi:2-dehydro-3-deoxyphosphogluconate aldolase / (4S)-4-hydroxy-2-oxoglutarate aldolase
MNSMARVLTERIVPVARGLDHVTAPPLVDALRAGGIHSIEITIEAAGGIEAIAAVSGGEVTVGAGSVVSIDQARKAVDAGAEFLVMPHLDRELLQWARNNDVDLVPGALTPSEIHAAWRYAPPAVKVFPAHVGGPQYLRSLLAPYPDLRLIPTGGINGHNIGAYLDAGAVAVGVGGWLTAPRDVSVVTERARQLVAQVV